MTQRQKQAEAERKRRQDLERKRVTDQRSKKVQQNRSNQRWNDNRRHQEQRSRDRRD
ncbi:MAG: hypothetical protein ACD_6C00294G0002 [uncultured bacterium]|nr:MAG: hypothetical protein ACD_6C00294G0002 [uncultured bacterium]